MTSIKVPNLPVTSMKLCKFIYNDIATLAKSGLDLGQDAHQFLSVGRTVHCPPTLSSM